MQYFQGRLGRIQCNILRPHVEYESKQRISCQSVLRLASSQEHVDNHSSNLDYKNISATPVCSVLVEHYLLVKRSMLGKRKPIETVEQLR